MYSSYALFGLDRNGDGLYAQSELSELLADLDRQLRARGHFTSASVGGRPIELADATEAAAKVEPDGALSLTFAKAAVEPFMIKGEDLSIEVRDVEYFVDFQFSRDRYATIRPPSHGCRASLSDGQPPAGSDPEALMKALIEGPVQTLGSSIHIRCD